MYIKKEKLDIKNLDKNDFVIDIETLGFSAAYQPISIIGYIFYENGSFWAVQLFSENSNDKKILLSFLNDLKKDSRLISFNGKNFDIPFINKRLEKNGLSQRLENENLDLYFYLKANQDFSSYPAIGQKKLEKLYGLKRESDLDGKKSIDLYKTYLKNRDESLRDELLYYNFLDIYNLSRLFDIYKEIMDRKEVKLRGHSFYIDSLDIKKDRLEISLLTRASLSFPVNHFGSSYLLSWDDTLKISLDLAHGLIGEKAYGSVFDRGQLDNLKDLSNYGLRENFILIRDENFHIENIRNIVSEILSDSWDLFVFA